jgi:proline dehydrogenase
VKKERKINQGNWKEHVGQSSLMFVNAAAWGLMLTGKLMETPKQTSLQWFHQLQTVHPSYALQRQQLYE